MVVERMKRLSRGRNSGLSSFHGSSSTKLAAVASPDVVKLVMLGDAGVGKTSLVLRLCHDTFQEDSPSTIGVAFSTKEVKRDDGSSIKFQIWDTAGQEQYHSLASLYYRSANAAVVAFEVTSRDSFKGVRTWIHELAQLGPADVVVIVAATKTDLVARRVVPEKEARAYAESRGALYFETSAKTNTNVRKIFETLSEQIHGRGGILPSANISSAGDEGTRVALTDGDVGPIVLRERTKLSCCNG